MEVPTDNYSPYSPGSMRSKLSRRVFEHLRINRALNQKHWQSFLSQAYVFMRACRLSSLSSYAVRATWCVLFCATAFFPDTHRQVGPRVYPPTSPASQSCGTDHSYPAFTNGYP